MKIIHKILKFFTSIFFEGDQDYKGIYWGNKFEDAAAHSGEWAYLRQGTAKGQLELGSDDKISIYETDGRVLAAEFSTNNKTLDVKGHMLEAGVKLSDKYALKGEGGGDFAPVDHIHDIGVEGNGLYVPFPLGAEYASRSSVVTGAIKIVLPVSWVSTMMSFSVMIYDYADHESFTINISGYNSSGGYWTRVSATTIGSNANRNFTVRFGYSGGKCVVYIGETNSTWGYPQIRVINFVGGYNNKTLDTWKDGWSIGIATSFEAVNASVVNTLVRAAKQITVGTSATEGILLKLV